MERGEFETMIEEGYERLPERVRKEIENVALLLEDEPSAEVRELEKLRPDETLLGLYQGIPRNARNYDASMELPDTITLYQFPIEAAAEEDGKDVRDVIAETIWHEFAHHFGMDETEVRLREAERDQSTSEAD